MIGGHGQRLAVKISATDDVASTVFFHKNKRIVGCAVELDLCEFARLGKGIANRAVNLRGATQAVGVLHAGIFFGGAMRFANFAAFVDLCEVARSAAGAGVGARVHDARVESTGTAAQRVERERSGDVGGVGESVGFAKREAEQSEHALRAVEEREAFLGFERDRNDFCATKGLAARKYFAAEFGRAFADDDLRKMCERREVAGSADGALRRNDRMNGSVQHGAESLDSAGTNSAKAFGESIGAQQHHGARFGSAEGVADAAGVRADEINL